MSGADGSQREGLALGFGLITTDEEGGGASGLGLSNGVVLFLHIIKAVFQDENKLVLEGGEELLGGLTNRHTLDFLDRDLKDSVALVLPPMPEGAIAIDFLKDGITDNPRNIGFIGLVLHCRQIDDFNIGHARSFWGAAHLIVRTRAES